MQLEQIKIEVLEKKKKVKKENLKKRQCFNFRQLREFNSEEVRQCLFENFQKAEKEGIKTIVVFDIFLKNPQKRRIFFKIMAQEIFRLAKKKKNINLKKILLVAGNKANYMALDKNVISYLNHLQKNKGPFLTVDAIVEYEGGIVLIKRKNPPLGWALPGGFVDYGEELKKAVIREVKEETNLDFNQIKQLKVYSEAKRDPRFHTVSVVFKGKGRGLARAASDAQNLAVFKVGRGEGLKNLPANIAFDHKKIIQYSTKNFFSG